MCFTRPAVAVPEWWWWYLDGAVAGARDEPVAAEVQAADGARVADQRHDGPGAVGAHVPHLDGLVRRATHDARVVKLHAEHRLQGQRGVETEGIRVALICLTKLLPEHCGTSQPKLGWPADGNGRSVFWEDSKVLCTPTK